MLHILQTITQPATQPATQSAWTAGAHITEHVGERVTMVAVGLTSRWSPDIDIRPNTDGLPGIAQLQNIVGAIMNIGLILAIVALIIAAIVWAFGANSSNPSLAGRGKTGILVAAVAGVVCGAAVALVEFGWNLGQEI